MTPTSRAYVASVLLLFACAAPTVAQQDPAAEDRFEPLVQGDKGEHVYAAPFFPDATYDARITTPAALLGRPVGSRMARHDEVLTAFRTWAAQSERMTLDTHGETYEGRPLIHAIITSPRNHARLAAIQADVLRLADPRGLDAARAEELIARLPAVAFVGYSIHGDETSGTDAALAVGHHLAACTDPEIAALLDELVVVLDPCMNPDGRTRIVGMVEQSAGRRSNLDADAMQRGRWPFGRGNHYLFDMNRDWMAGVCPETRARWRLCLAWRPQLFIDAHEMSGYDTFLTYPQSKPRNPALPAQLLRWQGVFADELGLAFDARGWGYYTREWADGWYPGYSDAWGSLNGAIGILYEQGRNAGQPLMRESGEVVPYREAVAGQAVASLANLRTLAKHRVEVLRDYLAERRSHVGGARPGSERVYVFAARPVERARDLVALLLAQGVEVGRAGADFEGRDAAGTLGQRADVHAFAAGSYVVRARQPQGALVRAYLELDPRIDAETLQKERASIERGEGSELYDVTAWDLGRQFGLDAWWCTPPDDLQIELLGSPPAREARGGRKDFAGPAYAWAVDVEAEGALRFVARALEKGLAVHVSDEEFVGALGAEQRAFARGSFLLRRHENTLELDDLVPRIADETNVRAYSIASGRAPDLERPDLGGGHFTLLHRPRVALLAGEAVSTAEYGHVWHYLDVGLGLPVTLVDSAQLGGYDLRRYNVLVVPPGGVADLLGDAREELEAWVRSGGTLIALGRSAAALADAELGLSGVRRRRDVLARLDEYEFLARRAAAGRDVELDLGAVWGDAPPAAPPGGGDGDEEADDDDDDDDDDGLDPDEERRDAWARRFMPAGAIVRAHSDARSWLTAGVAEELPVYWAGSAVLLAEGAVPVRLAPAAELRLGGLVWPEARARLGDSAWLTQEGRGHGQVILFAASPVFRGSWRGTERLLGNAVVLGPGAGANAPSGW
jgi:hypothetical protein